MVGIAAIIVIMPHSISALGRMGMLAMVYMLVHHKSMYNHVITGVRYINLVITTALIALIIESYTVAVAIVHYMAAGIAK
jgi:hypothetical protein